MEGLGGKVAAHARWTDDLAWRRSAVVGVAAMAAGSDCQKNQDDRQNIERGDPVGRIELEQREKRDDAAHNCRDRQRVVEPASVNCTHRSSLGHMRDHEVIRVSHLDLAKAKGLIHVSSRIVRMNGQRHSCKARLSGRVERGRHELTPEALVLVPR